MNYLMPIRTRKGECSGIKKQLQQSADKSFTDWLKQVLQFLSLCPAYPVNVTFEISVPEEFCQNILNSGRHGT